MRLRDLLSIGIVGGVLLFSTGTANATTGCNAEGGWAIGVGDMVGCDLYYPAVAHLVSEGIVQGYPNRTFGPDATINRAEFTKILTLASGERTPPSPCTAKPFPDVEIAAWYAPYICAAKAKGWISGFPDGSFKPDQQVNFANGSKMLVKAFGLSTDSDAAFYLEQGPIWYRPYTLALTQRGAVAPTIGSFTQMLNRGEMAEMIYRLLTGKTSQDLPPHAGDPNEGDDGRGTGNGPYTLGSALGVDYIPLDPPYVLVPHTTSDLRWVFGKSISATGYLFFHAAQKEYCSGESGLWEHCSPLFIDWSIGLYKISQLPNVLVAWMAGNGEPMEERYFGGRKASCILTGFEGENTEYCIVDLQTGSSLLVVRTSIDTHFMEVGNPLITSIETSDAIYARLRAKMEFVNY